jgi:hypothetical protein
MRLLQGFAIAVAAICLGNHDWQACVGSVALVVAFRAGDEV